MVTFLRSGIIWFATPAAVQFLLHKKQGSEASGLLVLICKFTLPQIDESMYGQFPFLSGITKKNTLWDRVRENGDVISFLFFLL